MLNGVTITSGPEFFMTLGLPFKETNRKYNSGEKEGQNVLIPDIKNKDDKAFIVNDLAEKNLYQTYDEINFLDVIHELEANGADAISLHPRTRKELYYGEPHYELVKDLQLKMNVPLIISGNMEKNLILD